MSFRIPILILSAVAILSCKKGDSASGGEGVTDSSVDSIETALSEAGAATGATEGGTIAFFSDEFAALDSAIESAPHRVARPLAACSYSNRSCSGATGTNFVGQLHDQLSHHDWGVDGDLFFGRMLRVLQRRLLGHARDLIECGHGRERA